MLKPPEFMLINVNRYTESHLRTLFSRYGVVQTCIVNIDKRHAFVKMINRRDAVSAREGMEQYKSGDMQLRVRVIIPVSLLSSVAPSFLRVKVKRQC